MTAPDPYPRDLRGYGETPPDPKWPGGARLAVSFVLNWEEGGETNVLHGDSESESAIQDVIGAKPWVGRRHPSVESMFEYGSRAGVWRLLRVFDRHQVPLTVFAVGMAVQRSPGVVRRMAELGHEICSHGYRWVDYQHVDIDTERAHVQLAIRAIEQAVGCRPLGWYTGRSSPDTRRLVVEEGGFLYDSDSYADDLPYWTVVEGRPHLVVPYTLDANDMRFVSPAGFASGAEFYSYLRDSFDVLYDEGNSQPKMMSVGLHTRLAGRPGRSAGLERFLEYVSGHDRVWLARRVDIARHWIATHPYPPEGNPA
ncbi:MAG TPA: allantoinase PuuE [Acidimicrobiales bacterium]|nr:allantoinase PuuE [Acidimicrobiales bacterium]